MMLIPRFSLRRSILSAFCALMLTSVARNQENTSAPDPGENGIHNEAGATSADVRIDANDEVVNNTVELAINPLDNRKVLAVSRIKGPDGRRGLAVYVSSTAGSTWMARHFWDIADHSTLVSPAIGIANGGTTRYYVGFSTPYAELQTPRLLESTDEGVTWNARLGPPGYQFCSEIDLIADPLVPDRLYYGFTWSNPSSSRDIIVAVSDDGGHTWAHTTTISSGLSHNNGGLSLASGEGGVLYAAWAT